MESARTQVHAVLDSKGNIVGFNKSVSQKAVWANKRNSTSKTTEKSFNVGRNLMAMNLQFFAQNDKKNIEQKIEQGLLSKEKFTECITYFREMFKNGIKTPITTVYDKKDRFYHIANRHDYMISKENINRIKRTLENPSIIYETKDKFSRVAAGFYVMTLKKTCKTSHNASKQRRRKKSSFGVQKTMTGWSFT